MVELRGKLASVAIACAAAATVGACGAASRHSSTALTTRSVQSQSAQTTTTAPIATAPLAPKPPPPPPYPQLLAAALATGPTPPAPAVRWNRQIAAWIERTASGIALMAFNQREVKLHLHSGTIDAGSLGWRYGPSVSASERRRLTASFNGGFRLSTGAGGFEAYGHVAVPLRDGLGSIVTYADGSTNIGSWRHEVPAAGERVVSVRQNLTLLIDHGAPAANLGCRICWGATLGGVPDPARSALGITADGRLIWAGGEHLTVAQLVGALIGAHVVRAVELDINPEWVAGYFYGHRGVRGPLAPVPALPSQQGIPGRYLSPWSRDFFTIVAR